MLSKERESAREKERERLRLDRVIYKTTPFKPK